MISRAGPGAALALLVPLLLIGPSLLRGELVYGYDTLGELAPWYEWSWEQIRAGHFPHWNPHFLAGMPFHAAGVVSLLYPPSLIHLVLGVERSIDALFLFHLGVAGLGTFAWLTTLGARWPGATLAAVTLSGSEALLSRVPAGELPQLAVVSWLPAMLALAESALARRDPARLLLAALPAAGMLLAGHLQYVVYAGLLWGAYVACRIPSARLRGARVRMTAAGVAVWILAGVLAAPQLVPVLEALPRSHRAQGLAPQGSSAISLPPASLVRALSPTVLGDDLHGRYWGESVALQTPLYMGLAPLALALYAAGRRVERRGFLVAATLLAIAYAMGPRTPVWAAAHRLLPPLEALRIPARALVVATIPLAALAGLGLDRLLRGPPVAARRAALLALLAVAPFALAWAITLGAAPEGWGAVVHRSLERRVPLVAPPADETAFIASTWDRAGQAAALALPVAVASTLALALVASTRRRRGLAALALISVVALDLDLNGARLIFRAPASPLDTLATALPAERPLRVLALVPHRLEPIASGLLASYGIGSEPGEIAPNRLALAGIDGVTGEIGLLPARTARFTGTTGRFRIDRVEPASRLDLLADLAVVERGAPAPFERGRALPFDVPGLAAFVNEGALPRALVSHAPLPVRDVEEAARAIWAGPGGTARPEERLVLEGAPGPREAADGGPPGAGEWAVVTARSPGRVDLSARLERAGWLVLLEPWDPHWSARRISPDGGGAALEVHPAQLLFRAVELPAGRHDVVFEYVASPYRLGVALILGLGLPAIAAVALAARRSARASPAS